MPSSLSIVQKFYPEVKKVVDARKDLNIKLKPSDVRSARTKKHDCCAMAQACKRQCKVDGAVVSTSAAYLIEGEKATRYFVPQNIAREIVAFDRGAGFASGEYALLKPKAYRPGRPRGRNTGERPNASRRKALRSKGLRTALSAI